MTLRRVIESSRYLVLIGVVFSLLAALFAFGWGAWRTVRIVIDLFDQHAAAHAGVAFVQLMDAFLIAAGLVVFAIGLYELFVGGLTVPRWLQMDELHQLKSKLIGIIVLVLGVAFLEHVVAWEDPGGTLQFGIGAAVVAAALIAYDRLGKHD